jgi:hypothetical protein
MGLGTNHESTTTLDVYIPEIWGQKINDFYRATLIMANFFTDRSDELTDGGDVIYTPNMTEMSANTKVNGSEVTLNSPTDTKITLTVNTWKEVSFLIEDREAAIVKRSYSVMERQAKNAGYTSGSVLEDAIAALFAGFSQTVGASTTNLADSEIRQAIATLANGNVDGMTQDGTWSQDVAFFLAPNVMWRQVMGLDRFTLLTNTSGADPVLKGAVGMLYGIPVYVSTSVPFVSGTTGKYNCLAHRDAIHFATQALGAGGSMGQMVGSEGIRVQSNYIPQYLGTLTTADLCYGVVANRDAAGVALLSSATSA